MELELSFAQHIEVLASDLEQTKSETYQEIKRWYNGYSWDGETFVYNPFSVLQLLEMKKFSAHWFATGTPTFLIKLLNKFNDFTPVLENKITEYEGFENTQSLENMQMVPLFFQTGYLTIKKYFPKEGKYELQIPNEEVRVSLLNSIIKTFVTLQEKDLRIVSQKIYTAFSEHDLVTAIEYLKTVYSNASYHDGIYNEGYYHNLFEIIAKFSGIDIVIESRTDLGRADSILRFSDKTYVIEMKYSPTIEGLTAASEEAMQQIKEKKRNMRNPGFIRVKKCICWR